MEELIIGEILKPQGIRGELKIKTYTDTPDCVKAFKTLYIDGEAYKILSFRVGDGDCAYVGLRGVPDRNTAELMRGKKLVGKRDDAPTLEEGQYYIVDLIGCSIESEKGKVFGTLKEITNLSSDVYTVEKNGKEFMFPAVKGVIVNVDIENKKITVNEARYLEVVVD